MNADERGSKSAFIRVHLRLNNLTALGRTYVPVCCQSMSADYQIFNVLRVEGE